MVCLIYSTYPSFPSTIPRPCHQPPSPLQLIERFMILHGCLSSVWQHWLPLLKQVTIYNWYPSKEWGADCNWRALLKALKSWQVLPLFWFRHWATLLEFQGYLNFVQKGCMCFTLANHKAGEETYDLDCWVSFQSHLQCAELLKRLPTYITIWTSLFLCFFSRKKNPTIKNILFIFQTRLLLGSLSFCYLINFSAHEIL